MTNESECAHRVKVRLVGSCGALWQCADCPALFEMARGVEPIPVDAAREAELRATVGPCV